MDTAVEGATEWKRSPAVAPRDRAVWLRRFAGSSPRTLWGANLLLVAISAAWVFFDPDLHSMWSADLFGAPAFWWNWRAVGAAVISLLAGVNFLWLFWALCFGSTEFRQLKALIVLVTLMSLWLGYLLNSQAISWQGRRLRLARYVTFAEKLADPLIDNWPNADGESPGLGPFMAYPVGRPTTLILLAPPRLSADGPFISAVEKSADGAVRFELSDAGGNDWLERHAAGQPASHVGGLLERREMLRATPLTDGWYLVRYRVPS